MDRELLELAAKAAGRGDHWWVGDTHLKWNPLTDDGDALRLAVKLDLDIFYQSDEAGRFTSVERAGWAYEHHNGDPYTATRRAIVRAAAEIGRSMK